MPSEPKTAQPVTATMEDLHERATIDRSTKLPVLFFLTSGAVWLILSSILGLLASLKLHQPTILDGWAWLTWGRLQPAFINAFIYGWCFQAAFGMAIWVMARLCRRPLKNPVTLVAAGHFWNLGVTLGVLSIFSGNQGPGEWLEFGHTSWLLLLASYTLIVVWLVLMYVSRPAGADYVSQWYILGACFWFPWLYLTANLFIFAGRSGLHAAATAAWYSSSLIFLFFVPIGLAASYYLIPKIVGRPLHSYPLAVAGFWSLALFGGWTGLQKLTGGPLPTWMPAVSGAAQWFLLIPVICVMANHYFTVRGHHGLVQISPTLRFTFAAAVFYVGTHLVAAILVFAPELTQFTVAQDGFQFMALFNYFSMAMFGAIYFVVPRLTGCEWLSPKLIRFHFWFSVYGGVSISLLMLFGGLAQGQSLATWDRTIIGAVENARGYLIGRTIGWCFILLSNFSFAFHLTLMVFRLGRRSERATLLHSPADYDHAEVMITTEGAEA
ncbi:MAG: cbb3-type cytochrome c oxidase subunit I [Verrucomicrobiales bacterium]